MRLLVLSLSITMMLLVAGCQKAAVPESAAAMKARIDSSVKAQLPLIRQRAAEDLDKRSAIEVKAKTDSIVNAVMHPKAVDSMHKRPVMDTMRRLRALQELHMLDSSRQPQNLLR